MVDRTSGVPVSKQVADEIRARIDAGDLGPGAALPSERELVDQYRVSRPTIRAAVALLRNQGLVVAEHGRGVFVRPAKSVNRLARSRLSREARARDKAAFLADAVTANFQPSVAVQISFEPADDRVAQLLQIDSGTEVTVRDRKMRADGEVVQLAVSRLPRELTSGTQIEDVSTGPGGTYARLEDAGHTLHHFDEMVSARMPTSAEQSELQLADGVPVITVTRIAYTAERPIEVNDMILAADRYELHYELPAD